jgi:hypothetical protein
MQAVQLQCNRSHTVANKNPLSALAFHVIDVELEGLNVEQLWLVENELSMVPVRTVFAVAVGLAIVERSFVAFVGPKI